MKEVKILDRDGNYVNITEKDIQMENIVNIQCEKMVLSLKLQISLGMSIKGQYMRTQYKMEDILHRKRIKHSVMEQQYRIGKTPQCDNIRQHDVRWRVSVYISHPYHIITLLYTIYILFTIQ